MKGRHRAPTPSRRLLGAVYAGRHRRLTIRGPLIVSLVLFAVLAGCSCTINSKPSTTPNSISSTSTSNPSNPSSTPSASGATSQVVRVIDGDTIVLTGDRTIRLIGIDTAERGQCGYAEARDHLRALIGAHTLLLTRPSGVRDTDRYGRFLRYVSIGDVDLGLAMIRAGHARARYDSRDGFGRHPHEALYVRVDADVPSPVCATATTSSTTS